MPKRKVAMAKIVDIRPGRVTVEGEDGRRRGYASLGEALRAISGSGGGEGASKGKSGLQGASQPLSGAGKVEAFLTDLAEMVEEEERMSESELLVDRVVGAMAGVDRHELRPGEDEPDIDIELVRKAFQVVVTTYVACCEADVHQAIGEMSRALVFTALEANRIAAEEEGA